MEEIINKTEKSNILSQFIDYTLLKPQANVPEIKKICCEAKKYHFASVCVNPCYIPIVVEELNGTNINPCCVIGFPLGATLPEVKTFEAQKMIEAGAMEIDMVINIGAVKSKDWDLVKKDIEGVVNASGNKVKVKVIIEACLLTDEEKVKVCEIAKTVGADFVKTSTGFLNGGATVHDVKLMRKTVGKDLGVKASGGIRDLKIAYEMINAGASRLGTSSILK